MKGRTDYSTSAWLAALIDTYNERAIGMAMWRDSRQYGLILYAQVLDKAIAIMALEALL